jgi:hypothetical protein
MTTSLYFKVNYGPTAGAVLTYGVWLKTAFVIAPATNASPPNSTAAASGTTSGVTTVTGLTLNTPYWIGCEDASGNWWWQQVDWQAGLTSGDPLILVIPFNNPSPVGIWEWTGTV